MRQHFTWHDVQRALLDFDSPPWSRVSVDPWRAQIECSPNDEARTIQALHEALGTAFDGRFVALASTKGTPRALHIEINPPQLSLPLKQISRPLWSSRTVPAQARGEGTPVVAAFFSYKGGVGRTTTAIAVAAELLSRSRPSRILLVDADTEAPGLTWLFDRSDRLSLLDAMLMVHDAEDWRAEAIPTIVGLLRANKVQLELPCGLREMWVLPSVRSVAQILDPPVDFEQMVRARDRESIVGDMFIEIAQQMGLDAVLVDLRAGVTELASPLLLDPRIRSVIVTSCNPQSVSGTLETIDACRKRLPMDIYPEVVVTMVPPDSPGLAESVTERILATLEATGDTDEDADAFTWSQRIGVHTAEFAQELVHYDNIESLARHRLPGTELGKRVAPELSARLVPDPPIPGTAARTTSPGDIANAAKKLEFAEQLAEPGLLRIPALDKLFQQPGERLPAAVVLGAKGAGKTFAWGQMLLGNTWQGFRELLGVRQGEHDAQDAIVFPVLAPSNLGEVLRGKIQQAESLIGGSASNRLSSRELAQRLIKADDAEPVAFWLRAITERLGIATSSVGSVRALDDSIRKLGRPMLLIIDGLEDALQPSPGRPLAEHQRRLLRTLLIDVVNDLKEIPQPSFGLIVFVRRDLAMDAIPQNFPQFEELHDDYQLRWTSTEVLRLPAWLLERAGWNVMSSNNDIARASYEELRKALIPFWGEKMGGNSEAYTDRWVVAALSDLNGQLQARDVIRLIRFAAEGTDHGWPLRPRAIRMALPMCSRMKLEELEAETTGLKPVLEKLRMQPQEKRTVPFAAEGVGLNEDEVRFLEQRGLITRLSSEQQWYMPEIVRHGLGYRLKKGARPKILRMHRMAQQRRHAR